MPEKAQEEGSRMQFWRPEAPGHKRWGRNYE
jgi:hypothetical protein